MISLARRRKIRITMIMGTTPWRMIEWIGAWLAASLFLMYMEIGATTAIRSVDRHGLKG